MTLLDSPPIDTATIAEWALWHHKRGEADGSTWVTAARPDSKAAYLDDWNRRPFTTEREVIRHWQHNPSDNIALVPRAGHFWLDADAPEVLDEAEDANGVIPATYTHRSLNGRLQLLLRGDVTSSGKVSFNGKPMGETRGAGTGQCIGAGSRGTTDPEKTGKPAEPGTWSIEELASVAEAPAWLLALTGTGGTATHGEKRKDYGTPIEWDTVAARALLAEVDRGERLKDYAGPFRHGECNNLTFQLFAEASERMIHPDVMLAETVASGLSHSDDDSKIERCQWSVYSQGNVQRHYGSKVNAYWLPNHVFHVWIDGVPQPLNPEDPVVWKARFPNRLPWPVAESALADKAGDDWENIPEASGDDAIMHGEIVRLVPVWGTHDNLYLPSTDVTIFAGPGGTGKSTETNGLALDVSNGLPHHGIPTVRMPALIVNFDDSLDLMKAGIRHAAHGRSASGVTLVSMFGRDMTIKRSLKSRDESETPFHKWLCARLERMGAGAKLVILDHMGALFGGDYIDRAEIVAFVGHLRAICVRYNATMIVLAHRSRSATTSGDLTFGAAAWSDIPRMYWSFDYEREKGKVISDIRTLTRLKVNHGKNDVPGTGLRLVWRQGQLVLDERSMGRPAVVPSTTVEAAVRAILRRQPEGFFGRKYPSYSGSQLADLVVAYLERQGATIGKSSVQKHLTRLTVDLHPHYDVHDKKWQYDPTTPGPPEQPPCDRSPCPFEVYAGHEE